MSTPAPSPPLNSQNPLQTGGPLRTATVRGTGVNVNSSLAFYPSMRTTSRSPDVEDDPRRVVQGVVREAAAGSTDRPILSRGRPGITSLTRRLDSTGSPPGTGAPVDIDFENGFSYIDNIEEAHELQTLATSGGSSDIRAGPSMQVRPRRGSFANRRPHGLSFWDARRYMRSGRVLRPGEWYEPPDPRPRQDGLGHGRREISRSRSRSRSPHDREPRNPASYDRNPRDEEEGYIEVVLEQTPSLSPHETQMITSTPAKKAKSLPWKAINLDSSSLKGHCMATLGELVGTTAFLFAAFGGTIVASVSSLDPTIAANSPTLIGFNLSRLLYMSFAFGTSYMVNIWIFFQVSEGFFNPAVTLALLLTGSIDILRSLLLLLAQIAGGVAASALALGLFQTTASVRTSLPETTSIPRGVFIEAILTAQLVLSVLMLAKRDQRAVCIAPLGIGLALFMGELVGIYHTGGSLNPARSFGPNAVSWTWEATHWVYWAGPCIGSLIAAVIHTMFMTSENDVREGGLEANAHKEPHNPYRAVRA